MEQAVTLRRLSVLFRNSWVFQPVARTVAAWSAARTVKAVGRRLGELSALQRVRVVGWTMVFAIVSEVFLNATIGVADVGINALGWTTRAVLLAFACFFIATDQSVVEGWREWRFQAMSDQTS